MIRYCLLGPACLSRPRGSEEGGETAGVLCYTCLSATRRDVILLPVDYFDLSRNIARSGGASDTKIARPIPKSMPPIDLSMDALRRDIAWALTIWEEPVREAAGLPAAVVDNVRQGWSVSTAVTVLAPRIELLASLPPIWCYADGPESEPVERDGRDAIEQLRGLHRRARNTLGINRLVVHLPGECSGCGAWALRRYDGSETVWCQACERAWTYEDYHRYVGLMIADPNIDSPVTRCRGNR